MHMWQQKAIKDAAKSFRPFQASLRKIARAIWPYETNKLNDALLFTDIVSQIACLRSLGFDVAGRRVVEIGTGWNPILPLLYVSGAAQAVTTVDQERLLDVHTTKYALK